MTNFERNTILVPVDFTAASDCAIDNAIEIAKVFNQSICLLHVIGKNRPKSEKETVVKKLEEIVEMISSRLNITVSYYVKEGSIFNAITNSVSDLSSNLIVMGVHGNPKEKDILGSFAYNVICSSKVPVMVVKSCHDKLEDNIIVAPVNFSHDNQGMADITVQYATELNCPVLVTGVLYHKKSFYKTIISKEKKEQKLNEIATKIKSAGINVKTDILIKPKNILVPTDFTPVASKAIEHAIEISKTFERQIYLLHVVSKSAKPTEIEKIEKQLKHIVDANKKEHGIDINYLVKRGSIFEVIPDTVSEMSAGFMVIGLHGSEGIESIPGSFANTIVKNSTVPVMVVKKNHLDIKDNKIVVQINYPHENVNKIKSAVKFAKAFDCIIEVIGVLHSEDIPGKKERNIILDEINEYLANKDIRYKSDVVVSTNSLLVPVDFTPMGDYAINYAIETAKLSGQRIFLIHIVDGNIKESNKAKIKKQLEKLVEDYSKKSKLKIKGLIEHGSIFNAISEKASDISADMIIMGIHAKKGLQHILGSNAFKVVKGAKVPVLVTKKEYNKRGIKNIVVPISFEHENTQKINKSIDIAKQFNSTIHLLGFFSASGSVHKIEREVLLKNVASHIENSGINVVTELVSRTRNSIFEDLLYYSTKVEADLIVIVAEKSNLISELLGRNYAENIINNCDIPILNIIPYSDFEEDEAYAVGSFIDPFGLMRKK